MVSVMTGFAGTANTEWWAGKQDQRVNVVELYHFYYATAIAIPQW